jgi:hypothetical protein
MHSINRRSSNLPTLDFANQELAHLLGAGHRGKPLRSGWTYTTSWDINPADRQPIGNLPHRALALDQQANDRLARRIGQRSGNLNSRSFQRKSISVTRWLRLSASS